MRITKRNSLQAYSVAALFLLQSQMAEANIIVENFNLEYNGTPNKFKNTDPYEGKATLTLNADGTVTADVVDYNSTIIAVGLSSAIYSGNFASQTGGYQSTPLAGFFGNIATSNMGAYSGIIAYTYMQSSEVIMTISRAGGFTDANQVLATEGQPSPIMLYTNGVAQYGTDLPPQVISASSPVPVPAAMWLFGTTLAGFISCNRRKPMQQAV